MRQTPRKGTDESTWKLETTVSIHVPGTPLKFNVLNPKSWRFGVNDFPFQFDDF